MNRTDPAMELARLNPELASTLSDDDRARMRLTLASILDGQSSASSPRRISTGRLVVSLACAAAVVAGIVVAFNVPSPAPSMPQALGRGALTAADLNSWTAKPTAITGDSPVVDNCVTTLGKEPESSKTSQILSADIRGKVQSAVVQNSHYVGWCVGTDANPMFLLLDAPGFVRHIPADSSVTLTGSGGKIGSNGYAFAAGSAGSKVVSVTIHEDGIDTVATVANGWWSAWWPSTDQSATVNGSVTVVDSDGVSKVFSDNAIRP